MKKYQIIYADPPWEYIHTGGKKNARGMAKSFYDTMPLDTICKLPVAEITNDTCALFLWATWPLLPEALKVIDAWGFIYYGLGFEWIKRTANGVDFFGMGYWTRANSEPCLLAFKGKMEPQCHSLSKIIECGVGEHSAKPYEVRDKIVKLVGDLPRIELFARKSENELFDDESWRGWDVWGNEVESDIDLF